MHTPNPSIFREYDIRGCYGETLHDEDAYEIGRTYARLLPENARVCVGYDGRHSSPTLAEKLISALIDSGINVINIGLAPSPALYFSVFHLQTDGAIMVTASHNPRADNGFKFMLGKEAMFGEQIAQLANYTPKTPAATSKGAVENIDIKQAYINRLNQDLQLIGNDYRIAWDTANGAMGEIVDIATSQLMENEIGGHFLINAEIDGDFPAHPADPTILANNKQLIRTVLEDDCDVGFGFDGDGDRIGVIDDKGRMIAGDQILAILARDVLAENAGAPIIADIKSSRLFELEVERLGGKPVLWKTGHSLIKAKMKELSAPLAGEMSGHIFFADKYYGYDDGLYAAFRFLNIMHSSGLKASELLDSLPKMHSSAEIKIPCPEERKFGLLDELKVRLQKDGREFQKIDGVRVESGDGWWLIRASNTSAAIIVRYESATEEGFNEVKCDLKVYLDFTGLKLD